MTLGLGEQSPQSSEYTRQLGVVTNLMLQNKRYQYYPMACLIAWIQPAIMLNQIKLFFNDKGIPIGYMTWAWLAPDVEERWIHDPKVMLHFTEWNEGEALWIMDFLALPTYARLLQRHALKDMFPDQVLAKSLRRKPDGSTRRVTTWRR
ncbi:toxin-activating lysine-acyltransferase [Metallibacterium scheffleri]